MKGSRNLTRFIPFIWMFSLCTFMSMEYWNSTLPRPGDSSTAIVIEATPNTTDVAPYARDASQLTLYGDDQFCARKSRNKYKYIDVSGMYNTGTNALYDLLANNCFGSSLNLKKYFPNDPVLPTKSNKSYLIQKQQQLEFFKHQHNLDALAFQKVYWSPTVGKHQMIPSQRDMRTDALFESNRLHSFDYRDGLHVVLIKDPLTWFKSICKASYYIKFGNIKWKGNALCPQNISDDNGSASVNVWHGQPFTSLVSTWNEFYESWIDQKQTIGINMKRSQRKLQDLLRKHYGTDSKSTQRSFLHNESLMDMQRISNHKTPAKRIPFVITRFEDVLFNPHKLVKKLCDCVGGIARNDTDIIVNEAKTKSHGHSRDRKQAFELYGDASYRFQGYTMQDVAFMKTYLNQRLLALFGYII